MSASRLASASLVAWISFFVRRRLLDSFNMLADTPLVSATKKGGEKGNGGEALTADVAARLELGGHRRIDRDHDLLLVVHGGVAVLNLVGDPVTERLPDHRGADVDNKLFRRLRDVRLVRQVVRDVRIQVGKCGDVLQRQVLVRRHEQELDLVVAQVLFLRADDVLQEVNRDVVCSK